MIRTIKVDLNAAFPNMPLAPFQVFKDSAAAITILNVPRMIADVKVSVKNASNVTQTFTASRQGSAWMAVIPGSFLAQSGTSTRGVKIVGYDSMVPTANVFTMGAADLVVMLSDGTVTPTQEGGDVRHIDFADLTADTVTLGELLRRLKGTASAFLLALLPFVCQSAVFTAPLKDLPGSSPVVTNVTAEAETDPTVPAWAKAANPPAEADPTVPSWAKAANPPAETDPTVPAWAKAANPPASMTTNAVKDIVTAVTNFSYEVFVKTVDNPLANTAVESMEISGPVIEDEGLTWRFYYSNIGDGWTDQDGNTSGSITVDAGTEPPYEIGIVKGLSYEAWVQFRKESKSGSLNANGLARYVDLESFGTNMKEDMKKDFVPVLGGNTRIVSTNELTLSTSSDAHVIKIVKSGESNAIAIGDSTYTEGGIAIGPNASAGESGVIIGDTASGIGYSFGYGAYTSHAKAVSIGSNAQSIRDGGIAIGKDSTVSHANAVVIGKGGSSYGNGTVTLNAEGNIEGIYVNGEKITKRLEKRFVPSSSVRVVLIDGHYHLVTIQEQ